MKKRTVTVSPFAKLKLAAEARQGDEPALKVLYDAYANAVKAYRANPSPRLHLDADAKGRVYWSAIKSHPTYPRGA